MLVCHWNSFFFGVCQEKIDKKCSGKFARVFFKKVTFDNRLKHGGNTFYTSSV
jgi:hypothetical protein